MTYVATETTIQLYDQDGTLLLDHLLDTPFPSPPVQIIRSQMISDPTFYIITRTEVYQFRCRLEEDNSVYKGLKAIKIVADWHLSPEEMSLSG